MKIFLVILVLGSSMAFAEKKNEVKDFSVLGRIDESTLKKVDENKDQRPELNNLTSSSDSRVSVSCKDQAGKEYKRGESGYETCVMNLTNQQQMNHKSKHNSNSNNNANSANFNFKVGN